MLPVNERSAHADNGGVVASNSTMRDENPAVRSGTADTQHENHLSNTLLMREFAQMKETMAALAKENADLRSFLENQNSKQTSMVHATTTKTSEASTDLLKADIQPEYATK